MARRRILKEAVDCKSIGKRNPHNLEVVTKKKSQHSLNLYHGVACFSDQVKSQEECSAALNLGTVGEEAEVCGCRQRLSGQASSPSKWRSDVYHRGNGMFEGKRNPNKCEEYMCSVPGRTPTSKRRLLDVLQVMIWSRVLLWFYFGFEKKKNYHQK